jgi:nicotinamidase-related amidase
VSNPQVTTEQAAESGVRGRLRRFVEPATTALLTMELQRGVVGSGALLPQLADEVERIGMLDVVRAVCAAARQAGVRVVHCTHTTRPDGAGLTENCRIFAISERQRRATGHAATEIGTPGVELVEGLEEPGDLIVPRLTGMTPFTSTALDQILRNLGIKTVIATGVSVNLGVYGMILSAVDLGYQVVLVRDAVAGLPADLAQAVIDESLSLVATVVTSADLLAVLAGGT